jgi:hypothetical protein
LDFWLRFPDFGFSPGAAAAAEIIWIFGFVFRILVFRRAPQRFLGSSDGPWAKPSLARDHRLQK